MKFSNPYRLMNAGGFTLIEMAMVLMIVALLLGGLLPTISGQVEQRNVAETRKQLDEIQQALIGYAIINGRLPCPASPAANTGMESFASGHNATDGVCSNFYNGYVPAATLGLSGTNINGYVVDAWGNPIHYAVTLWNNVYTQTNGLSTTGISNLPTSTSYLLVCSTSTGINTATPSCGSTGTSLTTGPGVPVIIFSTGKNGGLGGTTSSDETENVAGKRIFISHDFIQDGFDDIVTWISPNILINRMVSAGKLP
ncbi:MAG: prepilin-type N-terminal cleavage/methylation domain-containing protein [Gallionella sp.]